MTAAVLQQGQAVTSPVAEMAATLVTLWRAMFARRTLFSPQTIYISICLESHDVESSGGDRNDIGCLAPLRCRGLCHRRSMERLLPRLAEI